MNFSNCFIFFITLLNTCFNGWAERISDKRLCGDPTCSEPVSRAKALLNYNSDDERLLSFRAKTDITIYSKSAGSKPDLWGAEIEGKRGYIPKGLVREYKIFKSSLPYLVDTELLKSKTSKELKNETSTTPYISSSIGTNKQEPSSIEATKTKSDEKSSHEVPIKTPILKAASAVHSAFADISFPSFPGSGVSAEPFENEEAPKLKDVSKPYEVVEGTTVYLDTDGSQVEANTPSIQPTVITPSSQPSMIHEQSTSVNDKSTDSVLQEDISRTEIPHLDKSGSGNGNEEKEEDILQVEEEGSAGQIYQYISNWISEGSGIATEEEETSKISVPEKPMQDEAVTSSEGKNELKADELLKIDATSKKAEDVQLEDGTISNKRSKRDVGEEDRREYAKDEAQSDNVKKVTESDVTNTEEETGKKESDGDFQEESEDEYDEEGEDKEDFEDEEEEDEEEEGSEEVVTTPSPLDDHSGPAEVAEKLNQEKVHMDETTSSKVAEDGGSSDSPPKETVRTVPQVQIAEHPKIVPEETEGAVKINEQNVTPLPSATSESPELLMIPVPPTVGNSGQIVPLAEDKSTEHTASVIPSVVDNLKEFVPLATEKSSEHITPTVPPTAEDLGKYVPVSATVDDNTVTKSSEAQINYAVESNDTISYTQVEKDDISMPTIDTDYLSNNLLNSNNNAEENTVTESSPEIKTPGAEMYSSSEFIPPEKIDLKEEVSPITDNESTYVSPTEMPTVNKEEKPEEVVAAVVEELTQLAKEEVTEPTQTEEMEIEVPEYEPPTEATPLTPTTSAPEEAASVMEEDVSDEQGGEGFFSQVTGLFGTLFGGSSDSESVVEEVTEGNIEVTTEAFLQAEESERLKKRDAAWKSLWGGPSEGLIQPEESKAACRVNSDPSAGIDSDCREVSGDGPGYKGVPSQLEDIENVKILEDGNLTMDLQKSTYDIFVCLIITGVTVLLFSLGYFYIEKKRRDGTLVAKINELEKALLVSSKECLILKDDLEVTREKLLSIEHSSVDSSEVVEALNVELEACKVAKAELEEQVASLEKELEAATEAGLELNRMLSDFLSSQNSSETVMKSVEHLQKQLDSQQNRITSLTDSLSAKTTENENLLSDLNSALEKISSLEENVHKLNDNLNDVLSEKLRMEEELTEKNKSLENELEELKNSKIGEISKLQNELATVQDIVNEMKENLVTKESEVSVLQDCLKQLKSVDDGEGDDKLQALLDVGHTKAELKLLSLERDTLAEKLQGEEDARKLLEDHVKIITEEVTRLRESYEEAEREKVEAKNKLEVLSNYFKEKETQLQKELGLQEAMCLQKEGDATSTYEHIRSLQEEIEHYKSQNEILKKEIVNQERDLKSQMATFEKKAHENWVAARQAERKLEESKQEASHLRNRLTIVEKNVANATKTGEIPKMNDRLPGDSNGELTTSPVHMGISSLEDSPSSPQMFQHHDDLLPGPPLPPNPFMSLPSAGVFMLPPPPGAPFMPPPPPLFPNRRPPPLGRMSSPPPFSPPPLDPRDSYSPYDDRSPPPSPPPGRYRSPPPHADDSLNRYREHRSPPPPMPHFNPYSTPNSRLPPPPHWDDPHGTSRSGFRPLPPSAHRESPREPKGSALSSGHSSESLEKSSRHSGRV